LNIASSG